MVSLKPAGLMLQSFSHQEEPNRSSDIPRAGKLLRVPLNGHKTQQNYKNLKQFARFCRIEARGSNGDRFRCGCSSSRAPVHLTMCSIPLLRVFIPFIRAGCAWIPTCSSSSACTAALCPHWEQPQKSLAQAGAPK